MAIKSQKPRSHVDTYECVREIPLPILHSKELVLSSTKIVEDGKVCQAVDYVVDDSLHRYDGMKCDDFALENMLDAGVALDPVSLTKNPLNMLDSLEIEASRLNMFVNENLTQNDN